MVRKDHDDVVYLTKNGKMAGRGTDIVLDELAKKAGGLKVIGTERHEARKELLSFDKVNDTQRELVYMERRKILEGENLQEAFRGCLESVISQAASMGWGDGTPDCRATFYKRQRSKGKIR